MLKHNELSLNGDGPELPLHPAAGHRLPDFEHADLAAQVDLRQAWRTLRRHWLTVLLAPLALMVPVAVKDMLATPLYTARATVLIKNAAPQLFRNSDVEDSNDASEVSDTGYDLSTEYELLKSQSLAADVIASQGLNRNPTFTHPVPPSFLRRFFTSAAQQPTASSPISPALVGQYLSVLSIAPIGDTRLVSIGFTSSDPQLAAAIANAHAHRYIERGLAINSEESDESEQFLQNKLEVLKRQVEDSDAALNRYRRDKDIIPGLISLDGKDESIVSQLDKLGTQAEEAHLKTISLETSDHLIAEGRDSSLPAVINSSIIQSLKGKLNDLNVRYSSMAVLYKPDFPDMQRLASEIRDTRASIKRETDNIVDSIKTEYLQASADERNLDSDLAHEKAVAFSLDDAAVKYNILAREADTNRALYDAVLKRMKDVEVTQDLHASHVSIVDLATPPLGPSSPHMFRDLIAAGLFGLIAGVLVALFVERHDQSLKDSEETEAYLRIPVLALIPNYNVGIGAGYRLPIPMRSATPLQLTNLNGATMPDHKTGSVSAEAYRILRTSLLLSRAGSPPKIVLITSAVAQEGKTSTAINLAIALAHTKRKVLLIDADLRRPNCHRILNVANGRGLTEVLTGLEHFAPLVHSTAIPQLSLMSSGQIPPNPSELLGSDKMAALLIELASIYDSVIVDTAPIIPVTDALLLAGNTDGVILIAGHNTDRQQVKLALSRLMRIHAPVLGVVLNKADWAANQYHHYYKPYTSDNVSEEYQHQPLS
jgi:succinoglycan biosynthesis transport protein ExoP